jgi:hypothetical protein
VWFKGAVPITKQKWPLVKFEDYNRTLVSNSKRTVPHGASCWFKHEFCFLTMFTPFSYVCCKW